MHVSWVKLLGIAALVGAVTVLFPELDEWRRVVGTALLCAAIGLLAEDWINT